GTSNTLSDFTAATLQTLHQTSALGTQFGNTVALTDGFKGFAYLLRLGLNFATEFIGLPIVLKCCSSGDKPMVVAAKSAVVFTGFPLIQLGLHQHHRQRQAKAAQGF